MIQYRTLSHKKFLSVLRSKSTLQVEGTRWLIWLCFLFVSSKANAQYDTLLNRSFNDRYPRLFDLLWKYPNPTDSSALLVEINSIAALAEKNRDRKLLAELNAIQFKLLQRSKTITRVNMEDAFHKAIKFAEKLDYIPVLAALELYLSDYYWAAKDYPPAIQHLEKSYELVENLNGNDFYLKQEIAYQIGSKYYYLTDYTAAIHYLYLSLKDPNPLNLFDSQISIYNTLGLAYLNQGNLDSSKINFLHAIDFANKVGAKTWIGNLSGNLGHVYLLQGDLEKAESLLRIDKEISLAGGAKGPAIGAMLVLADLNFNKGKVKVAEQLLDSAMLLMGPNVPFNRKKSLFPLLSKLNAYKGEWKLSAMYMDSSLMVMDSVARLDNAVQTLRLKQLVELQESRVEISDREASIRKRTMLIYVMIAGLFVAIGGGFFVFRQKKKADMAKKRSDELLLNILPQGIADELKSTGVSRARKFTETSILFCDFKDFTQYSEELEPEALVQILDEYFRSFDQVITEFGLEKIKTVGDAYICASGLPVPNALHAEKVVRCALKFQELMKNNPVGWQLRIGVHSGSVVAGIVGIRKFAYDIWGDTVNTAARMEQHAEAGQVNISQATYELVKDKFHCTHRGRIAAKHKGELDMYYVEGMNDIGF